MADAKLKKILKLTPTQYSILENGGTVGEYTGLNPNYIYLTPYDVEIAGAVRTTNSSTLYFWKGTQEQYDALATKNSSTLYIII